MSHIQNPGGSGGAGTDDQTAAEVPFTPAGTVAATDVQAAIVELDGDVQGHITDAADAHDASAISVDSTTLVGTGTDVQAVLEELDNAIAAATGTPGGADKQIQFNDAGSFGGDALLIWDKTAEQFTVGDVSLVGPFFQLTYSSPTLAGLYAFRTQLFYEQSLVNALATGSVFSWFYSEDSTTDGSSAGELLTNLVTTLYAGKGGVAFVGTRVALGAEMVIEGAGNAANEYSHIFGVTRADIGTGFTQTAAPVGRIWGCDLTVLGSVVARPAALNGIVQVINNYYNGSPLDSPSAGMWIVTKGNAGGGLDATHGAATSYAIDVGIGIVGESSSSGVGFTKGMQIGGTGSPWGESASKIGTGIHIRDYTTHGIKIDNPSGSPTASIEIDGTMIVGAVTASRPAIYDASKKLANGTYSGNTTQLATVTGTKTTSQQLAFDADGNVIASGTAIGGATVTWEPPQGLRLSLTTNVYVTTTDVTAAGTLYWTTVVSGGTGVVTGYNGAALARKTVQQKSLSLSLTSGKNYDVFYDYDGDVLALSAAWTTDTARADALADEQGAIVLGSDHTKLWLGTIRASGSNVTEDSIGGATTQVGGKGFVWNKYNQDLSTLKVVDKTNSWAYSTATIRQANGNAGNQVEYVVGEASVLISAELKANLYIDGNNAGGVVSVGVDSTTVPSGFGQVAFFATATLNQMVGPLSATYSGYPGLGYHKICWLESGNANTGANWLGDNGTSDGTQSGLQVIKVR